jgi:DnaJ-class molecular chaperone
LGLLKTASDAEIKTKFYTLAKKYHPDAKKDCTVSEEKFK